MKQVWLADDISRCGADAQAGCEQLNRWLLALLAGSRWPGLSSTCLLDPQTAPTGFARLGAVPDLFLPLVAGLPDAADLSASCWGGAFLFVAALFLLAPSRYLSFYSVLLNNFSAVWRVRLR
ncbi:hypothetical protein [Alcanivorax quisquiliarum]|uniref:Uncharacterized protein n=1 Tax=Alcanivorax quisquiliarum TaxID=2933565 RepID=A0ABT0E2Y2_9GAMM|nr:hypothetical protein [Alcanivorax quisquiliarum]MCK0536118.1 hypothetical protein [Alcanivorax quisquiliarum]